MKYVVLALEDNVIDAMDELPEHCVGIFKAPTAFCDPSDGHRGKKTQSGFTRGKKYGWWVCAKCKKPTMWWGNNLNAVLGSAYNLLPKRSPATSSDTDSTAPSATTSTVDGAPSAAPRSQTGQSESQGT